MSRKSYASLAVLTALVLLAGCSGTSGTASGTLGTGQGQVRITLSGATATTTAATSEGAIATGGTSDSSQGLLDMGGGDTSRTLQSANVTFASILARNLEGQLIDVTIDLPVTIDVLGLATSGSIELPVGFLPPGEYDQLVVVMTAAELTFDDGTVVQITPPGGGWTAVIPAAPFTVVEGETTQLELRFFMNGAFRSLNGEFEFHPEFECRHD